MITKIRVLQLVEDFGVGGREHVVETIFKGLDKDVYEVEIWCIAGGGELAERLVREGRSIRLLSIKTYYNPLNILKLARLLKKSNFHIIHTHSYFSSTFGRISAVLARIPIIVSHVHTTHSELNRRNRRIERLLSYVSDKIVCCSDAVRDFVVSNENIPENKAVTIYNGVHCRKQSNTRKMTKHYNGMSLQITVVASLIKNGSS